MSFAAERRDLRWRYLQEPWTRRDCAVHGCDIEGCGIHLHHATYSCRGATELLALVPLCAEHHRRLELEIWPRAKGTISRSLVTTNYIVHGDALRACPEWSTPVITRPHGDQLAIWDQAS